VRRLLVDAALAAVALPAFEVLGRVVGPRRLVAAARYVGRHAERREPAVRAQLGRVLYQIDARLPGGARCYRRVLSEIALDRGAAEAPFVLGFDGGGSRRAGHAWLGEARGRERPYDVEIAL
jgi:hypothetical protein